MARSDFLMRDLPLEKQDSKIPLVFTGKVNDYYTVVDVNEVGYGRGEFNIKIGVSTAVEEDQHAIDQVLTEILNEYKPQTAKLDLNYLAISGIIPFRKKNFESLVTGIVRLATSRLKELGVPTGDFLNGDRNETISLYHVDSAYLYLSDESYQQLETDVELKRTNAPEKSIQAGIGGAVLGAFIGAIVWGILLFLGIYGWYAGVLAVFLAFRFYEKNNGLLTRPGIIAVVGVVITTLLITNHIIYSILLYQALKDFGFTFPMVLLNLMAILREANLLTVYMIDLLIGVGISGLYGISYAYRLYQTTKNDGKIRKI